MASFLRFILTEALLHKNNRDPLDSHVSVIVAAIKRFRWKSICKSKSEEEQKKMKDEPPSDFPVCSCNDENCIDLCDAHEILQQLETLDFCEVHEEELQPSQKLDSHLCDILRLIAESYLALGEFFKQIPEFDQAVKSIELAWLVFQSMPLKARVSYDAKTTLSFRYRSLSLLGDVFLNLAMSKPLEGGLDLVQVGACTDYNCKCKFLTSSTSFVPTLPREEPDYSIIKSDAKYKKKKPCSAHNCKCESCISSSSLVPSLPKQTLDEMSNSIIRIGSNSNFSEIVKYPNKNGIADMLFAALGCYKALDKTVVLESTSRNEGLAYYELGLFYAKNKDLGKAGVHFLEALGLFQKYSTLDGIMESYLNLGTVEKDLADRSLINTRTFSKSVHDFKIVNEAIEGYSKSINYIGLAVEHAGCRRVRSQILKRCADTYNDLGNLLAIHGATAVITNRKISAEDCFVKVLAFYEDLRAQCYIDLGARYYVDAHAQAHCKLADYYFSCCSKALQLGDAVKMEHYVKLADMSWKNAMDLLKPDKNPSTYLTTLITRSGVTLQLSEFIKECALPLELSISLWNAALETMLEARHMSADDFSCLSTSFWKQMQDLLRNMLAKARKDTAVSTGHQKKLKDKYQKKLKDTYQKKLERMFRIALQTPEFTELTTMQSVWSE